MLVDLSQRLTFDEKIRCDVCVEEAYYATNDGLARPFSSDRWVDKCPGCLGPRGAKTATDGTKAWSIRVCSRCQKENPGNNVDVYHGKSSGGSRKRAAVTDHPVEDEQPNFSTSQLVPCICDHLETPIELSLHAYEAHR